MPLSYHHERKISKLMHGFWARIRVWWLGREESSLLIGTFSSNCYPFFLKHTLYVYIFWVSLHSPTSWYFPSYFFCSRTEVWISFETTSAKSKDCLISCEVFPGLRPTLLNWLATDLRGVFRWYLYVVPSFVFSFSTDALTDVVLHCFFSIPSSLPPTLQFFYKSNCHFVFFSSSRIFLVWGTSLQRERVAVLA